MQMSIRGRSLYRDGLPECNGRKIKVTEKDCVYMYVYIHIAHLGTGTALCSDFLAKQSARRP